MLKKLTFLLSIIGGVCFGQQNSQVIVVGRVLNKEDSVQIRENFFSGLRAKASNKISESEGHFKQIVEIDPANHAALYELAALYHNQNEDLVAEKYARDAVTVKSDNKWYWLLLADIYKKTKRYNDLALIYTDLIRLEPNNDNYYFDKATALNLANKAKEAEAVYNEIEKKFGDSNELGNARQFIYRKNGNPEKAADELEKLISANAKNPVNYITLSEIYEKDGKTEQAAATLLKAKKAGITNPFIHLSLADLYRKQGKIKNASEELKIAFSSPNLNINAKIGILLSLSPRFKEAEVLNQALELSKLITEHHPKEARAFAAHGDVLFQANKLPQAKQAYKTALELDGQVYQIWEQLLRVDLSMKDYASAIAGGEEALSLFPNQAALYFYTAIAYAQSGKHENAIIYLKTTLELGVVDKAFKSQIYSTLGDSHNALKNYRDSDRAYNEALELDPDNSYVLNNYAYYLSLRGDNLDKAAEMSARSNKLRPGNPSFEDTYAWVLFKQKKYQAAREWIEKAMKTDSKSGVLTEHYGDILYHLGEKEKALRYWKQAKDLGVKSDTLDKKINEKKYAE